MKPQVNLLDDLAEQSGGLSPYKLIVIFTFAVITMITVTLIQGVYVSSYKKQLNDWKQKANLSLEQLEETQKKFPNLGVEDQITNENAALQREITEQRNILSLLDSDSNIQTEGFYSYLLALSNNARQGIWLTEIELMPGEVSARLKGQAVSPELVPRYIEDLANTKFTDTNIGRLNLVQMVENPNLYSFEIATSIEATNKGALSQ